MQVRTERLLVARDMMIDSLERLRDEIDATLERLDMTPDRDDRMALPGAGVWLVPGDSGVWDIFADRGDHPGADYVARAPATSAAVLRGLATWLSRWCRARESAESLEQARLTPGIRSSLYLED